jgi:hypothetical protein
MERDCSNQVSEKYAPCPTRQESGRARRTIRGAFRPLTLVLRRMQHAERAASLRPHQHQSILAGRDA